MENLLLGPYIGNFYHEIVTFRPYIKYISSVLECDNTYISSHSNRSFLYDWIPHENFIPVYEHLSRGGVGHTGYTHSDISKAEFTQITKKISRIISPDIDIYSLPYSKLTNIIPFHQKIYTPISFPDIDIDISDYISFIPDNTDETLDLYNSIKNDYNVVVVGDMSNGMEDENVVIKDPDYFTNGYIKIFNYIHKSKLVITPCDQWAMICNLQNIPVIYYGKNIGLFKKGGVYGFDNDNALSVCDITSKTVDYMLEKMGNK